jgi:MFS family permease
MIFTAYSAVLPLVKGDWRISAGEAGLVQSAWHMGYLTSLFAVGFLADHYGARRTFLWTSIAASVAGLTFALFAHSFWSALLLHGLAGLCSGGSYTPGLALISQRFSSGGQGRAMGFYLAAASLGYGLTLVIAGALIASVGWRGVFLVIACGPILATLVGFGVLRDTPNLIHPRPTARGAGQTIGALINNRPAMLSIWGYVFHAWELLGLWAWLPAFLAAAQGGVISTQAVSLGAWLTALTYLLGTLGSALAGEVSDRWGRTTVILATSVVSAACALCFGWMMGLPMAVIVAVALLFNFSGTSDSSIHSTALAELVPPSQIGAAYSVRSVLGFGAGAISPWVFGMVLDWGRNAPLNSDYMAWGLAWMTLGAVGALCPIATWRLRRHPEAIQLARGLK